MRWTQVGLPVDDAESLKAKHQLVQKRGAKPFHSNTKQLLSLIFKDTVYWKLN